MGIFEQLPVQLKQAMLAKDKPRTLALRGIRAALIAEQKSDGAATLSDDACVQVLRRLAKQRRESIQAYAAAGRTEAADQERGELAVIASFLPALADEPTLRAWITQAIDQTGASGPSDMGRVMGALSKAHKGAFDGKLASQWVRQALAG